MSQASNKKARRIVKGMASDIITEFMTQNATEIINRSVDVIRRLPLVEREAIAKAILEGENAGV